MPTTVAGQANTVGFGESGFVGIAQGHRIARGQVLPKPVDGLPVLWMKLGRFERTGVVDPEELAIIIVGEPPLRPVSGLLFRLPSPIGELVVDSSVRGKLKKLAESINS